MSILASHVRLNDFTNDLYPSGPDPIQSSSKLRLDGAWSITKNVTLPLTFQAQEDQLLSGAKNLYLSARATQYMAGAALTTELSRQSIDGARTVQGNIQLSRTIAEVSLRSQLAFSLEPSAQVNSGSLAADFQVLQGYLLNVSASREIASQRNNVSLNLNRSFNSFALRAGVNFSNTGGVSLGVQLFTSFGRDPHAQQWLFDVLPIANTGAASARVFLDNNQNGVFDAGDTPIKGASLMVNQSRSTALSDDQGRVFLSRLEPGQNTQITVNAATLEDSQWMPATAGVSILPRPGRVVELDFPVVMTTDIDGTVQLLSAGTKRGAGDALLELIDAKGALVTTARTSFDGYYLMPGVKAGLYQIRISGAQTRKLSLKPVSPQSVTIHPDGAFIKPVDFLLEPL